MSAQEIYPDYLFETSWEVCNKVGGIHTVVSSKALTLSKALNDRLIMIGPDVWREDEKHHPEFTEDNNLFPIWKQQAMSEGLRIRIGRWNIPGNPLSILVDFTTFIPQKDAIFAKFWESYKLDSLSGQWDYIEPALFGYATGRVIESFVKFNLSTSDKVTAHFHEWMSGTGVLYLKEKLPQVGTVFTTHDTIVGRTLAAQNKPLYSNISSYNPDEVAKESNIISKLSLERLTAFHADTFTTVSDLTSQECKFFIGKEVDTVTPNGIDQGIIPTGNDLDRKRKESRELLKNVTESLVGAKLKANTRFVTCSGRYEFRNKGIDLFIDALGELNRKGNKQDSEIVAFILVPSGHYGPRKELLEKMNGKDQGIDHNNVTHILHDSEYDPVLNRLTEQGLENAEGDRVKVVFVPSYLNGNDGIFNKEYYDLLLGMDFSVFPSYYEPWGYTPLESLAVQVPTITTSLAGFGLWVKDHVKDLGQAIKIIQRTDDNDNVVVDKIVIALKGYMALSDDDYGKARQKALEIAQSVLWEQQVVYYKQAFARSIEKVNERSSLFKDAEQTQYTPSEVRSPIVNEPIWKDMLVQSGMPEKLNTLKEISTNLWWSWNTEAKELFQTIDPELWEVAGHNPAILFEKADYNRLKELENDQGYLEKLNRVYKTYQDYLASTNYEGKPLIAYFSMEYGLHDSLKIYSGGLGLLAGDYLKEASDRNYNLIAFGLLYRYGYFKQKISIHGEQMAAYDYQDFSKLPVSAARNDDGSQKTVSVMLPGRSLTARIWMVNVGRVKLYLLDADFEANLEQDRFVTHHLYGGDNENRFKQELLLGIGGIRALKELGYNPDLYHSNEGHSAFIGIERLRNYIADDNLSFHEAKEIVRATTLFTTHTPVPAGHDKFPEDLMRTYIAHYPARMKIGWNDFMNLGKANPDDFTEKFNMSHLAAYLSQDVNGVSLMHGKVTRDMFAKLWKGYLPEELHVGHVTNGVHLPTWLHPKWKELFLQEFGKDFFSNQLDKNQWEKIRDIADEKIWEIKQSLKKELIASVRDRFKDNWIKRNEDPRHIVDILDKVNDEALTIGFARRFATYKRAHLLFKNLDRLAKIVNNPVYPVQFLFAGKAHPADKAGQDLIKMIVEISKKPEFKGKILFLQNYDITLATKLVQGVDIWLNTPTRPLEASGTSGEKGVMNGTLHFSVLDGWWVEGYEENAGWALPLERTFDNQEFQDELDAETVYSIIENEIVEAFYNRNIRGIPADWVGYIKNCIANVAPKFTTARMIDDYDKLFYSKLYERSLKIKANGYALARQIARWKKLVGRSWENIRVESVKVDGVENEMYQVGKTYQATAVLDMNGLAPEHIGVEMIITEGNRELIDKVEFQLDNKDNGKATFKAEVVPKKSGSYSIGFRMFPKNDNLPHRQDFRFLRWL